MSRQCGECSLCCRLLPVPPLGKRANERCKHQRHTGCAVYNTRDMPLPCKLWNCRWLTGDDTADLSRPDRTGYVIDMMPDFVAIQDADTGQMQQIEVVQIWCDPKRPDAHKDPALRAYLDRRGHEGILGLVRMNATEAFIIAPPSITGSDFVEVRTNLQRQPQHTAREIGDVIARGEQWKADQYAMSNGLSVVLEDGTLIQPGDDE